MVMICKIILAHSTSHCVLFASIIRFLVDNVVSFTNKPVNWHMPSRFSREMASKSTVVSGIHDSFKIHHACIITK